jgi:indole-3-acetate monooxygenase
MHIKLDRLQKNDRLIVDSMARETAQTKRAVDGILDLIHAAADESSTAAASRTRS